jgi:hypothetical protein
MMAAASVDELFCHACVFSSMPFIGTTAFSFFCGRMFFDECNAVLGIFPNVSPSATPTVAPMTRVIVVPAWVDLVDIKERSANIGIFADAPS